MKNNIFVMAAVFSMVAGTSQAGETYVMTTDIPAFATPHSALFTNAIDALDTMCQITEDKNLLSLCDVGVNIIDESPYECYGTDFPSQPLNDCEEKGVMDFLFKFQHEFREHFPKSQRPCEFSAKYECFTIKEKTFAFPYQPA